MKAVADTNIFVSGITGGAGLSQIARAGNALPSNLAPGLICNTTTGTNGLGSTQFEAGNGGILITGNLNGTGVTSTTSPFWMWRDSTGASNSILYRGGDVFNGLTIRREGADRIVMTIRIRRGETVTEEILRFQRAPL